MKELAHVSHDTTDNMIQCNYPRQRRGYSIWVRLSVCLFVHTECANVGQKRHLVLSQYRAFLIFQPNMSINYVQLECEYVSKLHSIKPHKTSVGERMQSLFTRFNYLWHRRWMEVMISALCVCLWAGYLKMLRTDLDKTWWTGWVCDKKLIQFSWRSGSSSRSEFIFFINLQVILHH